jgi:hypothetical protein
VTVTPRRPEGYDFGDIGVFPKLLPKVGRVLPGSPAEAAGFRRGDEMRAVDGRALAGAPEFVAYVGERAGQVVRRRDTARRRAPRARSRAGRRAGARTDRRAAVDRAALPTVPGAARERALQLDIARQSLAVVGKIFKREVAAKSALAGPIEIAAQSGAAARTGVKNLLYLMGVVSISIGLLNLFPIPILDGGQIVILLVESAARRDLSLAIKERIAQVGFALIVLLMVTVLYFDASKPGHALSSGRLEQRRSVARSRAWPRSSSPIGVSRIIGTPPAGARATAGAKPARPIFAVAQVGVAVATRAALADRVVEVDAGDVLEPEHARRPRRGSRDGRRRAERIAGGEGVAGVEAEAELAPGRRGPGAQRGSSSSRRLPSTLPCPAVSSSSSRGASACGGSSASTASSEHATARGRPRLPVPRWAPGWTTRPSSPSAPSARARRRAPRATWRAVSGSGAARLMR